jgi:hypothetical protein
LAVVGSGGGAGIVGDLDFDFEDGFIIFFALV